MEACWSFLEGHFPSFFFGSAFRSMCPPSSKFITWVFELQIFKLWTLLSKVHTSISSTFWNSLCSTISRFDLHSNELIDMYLGLVLRRSCMVLPNLGLGPLCCVKFFWGWGLLLRIFSSSPSSWSTKLCVVNTPWPEVVTHIIFLQENWACVIVRSCFTLGQSCPFSGSLHWVRQGLWLHIHMLARMEFLKLLI